MRRTVSIARKISSTLLSVVLVTGLLPIPAVATSPGETEETQVASLSALDSTSTDATLTEGWNQSGTCEWQIDGDGKLTVRPLGGAGEGRTGTLDTWRVSAAPWASKASSIKSVVIEQGVSAQTCMSMFQDCANLTSVNLSGLDTSAVTSMYYMFGRCTSLTFVSLAGLSTPKLADMNCMFAYSTSLKSVDFGSINTSSVTNMSFMFDGCSSLEAIDLSGLNTSAVKDTRYMLRNCPNLTSLDLSCVDLSNVEKMGSMLKGCTGLKTLTLPAGIDFSNSNLRDTRWEDSAGTIYSTASMFSANAERQTGSATYTESLLSVGWNQSGTCEWQIDDAGKLTVRPLGGAGEGRTGTLDAWSGYEKVPWYSERDSITSVVIEQGVSAQTCLCMFANCTNLTSVDLSGLDTSAVTSMYGMFSECSSLTSINLAGLDTSAVTIMYRMFYECTSLTSADFAGIDTSHVTAMHYMFHGCTSLTVVDFSDIDASSVTDTSLMFFNCPNLETIYASSTFKIAETAASPRMFENCASLKGGSGTVFNAGSTSAAMAKVDGGQEDPGYFTDGWTKCGTCEWRLDSTGKLTVRPIGSTGTGVLDAWDDSHGVPWDSSRESITSVVFEQGVCAQTCASMFQVCINLVSVDLSGLDTSAVTNMNKMFSGCTSLVSADLAGMDTSNVTNMRYLFHICTSLTSVDLSDIDTSSVTDMGLMFFNCPNLETIYASPTFTVTEGADSTRMFENCASLKGGRGTAFDEAHIDATMAKIDGGQEDPGYFTDDWTKCGTCEWRIDSAGTLTVRPLGSTGTGTLPSLDSTSYSPWNGNYIKSVVIEKGVKAASYAYMFFACPDLQYADLSGLDTSANPDTKSMLLGCTSITKLVLPAGMDLQRSELLSSSWRASTGENYETTAEMIAANASRDADAMTYRTISVSPGWSQAGSCEWRIDDSGLLTVRPLGSSGTGTLKAWAEAEEVPWYYQRETITAVKVASGVSAQTCASMFEGCTNLGAADLTSLDASAVTDMSGMFCGCSSLASVDFGSIDTSSVTTMSYLFDGCTNLEAIDLSSLNASAVTDVQGMFRNCSSLTSLDLSCLSLADAESMTDMLSGCSKLETLTLPAGMDFSNSGLHEGEWTDTSETVYPTTASLFSANAGRETGAMSYKAVVIPESWTQCGTCEWQIDEFGQLTVRPLSGISAGTLDTWTKIEEVPWYSSRDLIESVVIEKGVSAQTCRSMFEACKNLTSVNLAGLDTSAVTDMSYMFSECTSLSSINLVGLNTSAVISMNNMFYGCTSLTQADLVGIDTSKVTNMNLMFRDCTSLVNVDLSDIDTSLVTNMSGMFMNCTSLVTIYASPVFVVAETAVSTDMFEGCTAIEGESGTTYVSNITDATMAKIDGGEEDPGYLTNGWTECGTCEWRIDSAGKLIVRPANGAITGTLDKWTKREEVPWYPSRESIKSVVIEQGVSAQTCVCMFEACTNLVSVDLTGLDTSAVTDMSSMFYGCTSLTSIDLMSLDTSSAISMWGMFNGCISLEHAYLAGIDTAKLIYTAYMFHGCTNLVTVDLTDVDTSSVSTMSYMFWNCQSLTTIYATSAFKVAEGVISSDMFWNCFSLKGECGTTCATRIADATMAKIDGGQEDPGYFTTGWDKCGTCEWKIDSAGKLTIRPLDGRSTGTLADWTYSYDGFPWYANDNIKSVVVEKGVKALTCTAMFVACENLKQADLSGLDTSAVTDMRGMFARCENLESVNIAGLDTSANPDTKSMFLGCTSITKLVLPAGMDLQGSELLSSSWRASSGENYETTTEMIAANAGRDTDAMTYRTISVSPSWSQAGSCEWRIDDSGLLTIRPLGSSGTGTIKAWAEAEEVPWYYQRETITAVKVASGVSAQTCAHMFEGCTNLGTADLTGLDVSAVTDMSSMFANCPALTGVPTGLVIASGAVVDDLFYVDSETAIATRYDGEDSAIINYGWADDNRTLVVTCKGEHAWDEGVIIKAATCTEPGEKTLTCTLCGEVQEGVVIDALGHSFKEYKSDNNATCEEDGTETATCANGCGTTDTRSIKDSAKKHSWGEWETVTEATCGNAGLEKRVCANDPTHVETQAIAQLVHDWLAPVILFSSDYTSATAIWTCKNNASHISVATFEVASTVVAATCETAEVTTYTATAKKVGMPDGTATATRTTASAKGHAWGNPTIVFATDKTSATATWTCATDAAHKHTETCTVEKQEKKAATCFEHGENVYAATAFISGTTAFALEAVSEEIPAIGHNFNGMICADCETHLGDVNGNGSIDIVDAQIAYDIAAHNSYVGLDAYDAYCAAADVTGENGRSDGYVEAQDAFRIQYILHYGWGS